MLNYIREKTKTLQEYSLALLLLMRFFRAVPHLLLLALNVNKEKHVDKAIIYLKKCLDVSFPDKPAQNEIHAFIHGLLQLLLPFDDLGDESENIEQAIAHLKEAMDIGPYGNGDHLEFWRDLHIRLGDLYLSRISGYKAENQEEAINCYQTALDISNSETMSWRWVQANIKLGEVYEDRIYGDPKINAQVSLSYFQKAFEVCNRDTQPYDWAKIQKHLGSSSANKIRLEERIEFLNNAITVFTRETYPLEWASTNASLGIAYSEYSKFGSERDEKYEFHYRQAQEVFTYSEYPEVWAELEHNISVGSHLFLHDPKVYNEQLRKILGAIKLSNYPSFVLKLSNSLAEDLYRELNFSEARYYYAISHEAIESMRGRITRKDAKQKIVDENSSLYENLIYCCLIADDIKSALEYVMARKSRLFIDRLATNQIDLTAAKSKNSSLANDLQKIHALRKRIDELTNNLTNFNYLLLIEKKRNLKYELSIEISSLQEQELELWQELEQKYPALAATQKAPTVTWVDVMKMAGELDVTIVEYYRHSGGWCAFVINASEINTFALDDMNEEFSDAVLKWIKNLESPAGRGELSYKVLREIHRILIKPLTLRKTSNRLIFAPFGVLHQFPFAAALDATTNRFLAEDYVLAITPSAAAFFTAKKQLEISGLIENQRDHLLNVAYSGPINSDIYLSNVLPEAQAIANKFPKVKSLYENDATIESVIEHIRDKQVVHFGCHGYFKEELPLQSGLMLADGWLTVQRIIAELDLSNAEIVTLGACLSGKLNTANGDELVGLTQSILTAGAKSVAGSLWSVNDLATRVLFEVFYSWITAGEAPARAMQIAMQTVRNFFNWKHPYFWAGFSVSGLAYNSSSKRMLSELTIDKIYEERQNQLNRQGVSHMSFEDSFRDATVMLSVISDNPEDILLVLSEIERQELFESLESFSSMADKAVSEVDILNLTDEILKISEASTKLRTLLLPEDFDFDQAQTQRAITLKTHKESSEKSDHAQKKAAQIRNSVITCRDNLIKALKK